MAGILTHTAAVQSAEQHAGSANDLRQAFTEVSASSAGGAPFLISYGATFFITAILSFVLPRPTTALIAMFQGGVALPIAFWLEGALS